MTKGPGECYKAPKAEVADLGLTLSNGLQAIEDLEMLSASTCVDSTKAKMVMMIVAHVEADLDRTHHSPLLGVPNVDGFHVARTRGTTRWTQKIRTQGAEL
jgi:hypothetical protein